MSDCKEYPKIELSDTTMDVLLKMAQGNPGALDVMMRILDADPEMGLIDLLSMDDMRMRGPAIWVGYKDHCGEDLGRFRECVRERDSEMLDTIKRNGYSVQRFGAS